MSPIQGGCGSNDHCSSPTRGWVAIRQKGRPPGVLKKNLATHDRIWLNLFRTVFGHFRHFFLANFRHLLATFGHFVNFDQFSNFPHFGRLSIWHTSILVIVNNVWTFLATNLGPIQLFCASYFGFVCHFMVVIQTNYKKNSFSETCNCKNGEIANIAK